MNYLKAILKDILAKCYKQVLKVYFIFPIKQNRVFFQSYLGQQYSCNPKYISEKLETSEENFEIVWAFKKPEEYNYLRDRGIIVLKYESPKYWYYRMTARVTVSNVNYRNYTPIRKGQYEIQTWHGGGGGYKKTMNDDKEVRKDKLAQKRTIKDIDRYSLLLTSSATSLRTNARQAIGYKGVVLGGTPRNDILINRNREELNNTVRSYFNLKPDDKILLYAPTWRKNNVKEDFDIDYKKVKNALHERFGGNWVVLSRMHRLAVKMIEEDTDDCIRAEDYPDMQELLYAADVLISDYSSSIWDYSFTGKPCFLFCTDLSKYQEDRDFYNPITTWGFPLAQSNKELCEKIIQFNAEEYSAAMDEQHEKNTSFENGHTAENVCKIIESVCYGDGELPQGLPYKYYEGEPDTK